MRNLWFGRDLRLPGLTRRHGAPLDNVFRALDGSVVVGFLNNPPSLVLVQRSDGVPVVMPENYASLLLVDNVTRDPNSGRVVVYSLTNPPTVTLIEGPLGPLVVFGAT
jgi:hypothetical protein